MAQMHAMCSLALTVALLALLAVHSAQGAPSKMVRR